VQRHGHQHVRGQSEARPGVDHHLSQRCRQVARVVILEPVDGLAQGRRKERSGGYRSQTGRRLARLDCIDDLDARPAIVTQQDAVPAAAGAGRRKEEVQQCAAG